MGVLVIHTVVQSEGEDIGSSEGHGVILIIIIVGRKVTGPAQTGMEAHVSCAGN